MTDVTDDMPADEARSLLIWRDGRVVGCREICPPPPGVRREYILASPRLAASDLYQPAADTAPTLCRCGTCIDCALARVSVATATGDDLFDIGRVLGICHDAESVVRPRDPRGEGDG